MGSRLNLGYLDILNETNMNYKGVGWEIYESLKITANLFSIPPSIFFRNRSCKVKVSAMDFLPRAKLLMCKEWQEIWNCCDGNKLHAINPTVGVTKLNGSLSRKDAVIINRLQIGHTRATHAHLLGGDDEAFCTTCYTSLLILLIQGTKVPVWNIRSRERKVLGTKSP